RLDSGFIVIRESVPLLAGIGKEMSCDGFQNDCIHCCGNGSSCRFLRRHQAGCRRWLAKRGDTWCDEPTAASRFASLPSGHPDRLCFVRLRLPAPKRKQQDRMQHRCPDDLHRAEPAVNGTMRCLHLESTSPAFISAEIGGSAYLQMMMCGLEACQRTVSYPRGHASSAAKKQSVAS